MGHRLVAHLLFKDETQKETAYLGRQAVDSGMSGSLADVLEGILGPKLLFLELLKLYLLDRSETQPAIEGVDALGKLSMLLLEMRLLSLCWDDSSVLLGHVTSGVLTGFTS